MVWTLEALLQHPVVITVVFHPKDDVGKKAANSFVAHFDRIGMQRSGVQTRVPVRFRSEALTKEGDLAPITRLGAEFDVIVVLYGPDIDDKPQRWRKLCEDAAKTGAPLVGVVAYMEEKLKSFKPFQDVQAVNWVSWRGLDDAARARQLMIHVVNAIRRRLRGLGEKEREKIFLSHAKADGKIAAELVMQHITDPNNELRLSSFYDASELETGEEWAKGLREAAASASMLALATDAYDGRPWCNQEILWAKQNRRPLLIVDIGRTRVERCFPYSGNVTWIRDPLADAVGIEKALLELLSEALRCDLFARQVEAATKGAAIAYPRPPELLDLALLFAEGTVGMKPIVYPDPALPTVETELLAKFLGERRVFALSDYK